MISIFFTKKIHSSIFSTISLKWTILFEKKDKIKHHCSISFKRTKIRQITIRKCLILDKIKQKILLYFSNLFNLSIFVRLLNFQILLICSEVISTLLNCIFIFLAASLPIFGLRFKFRI